MKLHLGCGGRNFGDDWIHIDQSEYPHVVHQDVTNLPFDNDSCDLIYASHLLEYFDGEEVLEILAEWNRVLKPGGILRMAVPDFEAISTLYNSRKNLDLFLGPLYGKMGNPPFYHRMVYDLRSLRRLLERAKFSNIKRYNWRRTEHSHFDDHSQAYIPHMDKENGTLVSLNVECKK